MPSSETQIANLVYRYAECIDSGDLEGAAALFSHARIETGLGEVGPAELLEMWRKGIMLYDGVPRTKHVITNPIIEVDEDAGTATCRSVYTVIQQAGDAPLQPVICGRYHDRFVRGEDGNWRYAYRDYSLIDLIGDMTRHSQSWSGGKPPEGVTAR
ncbi:MAG: nuclear transport factor 2 family protein [Novosphingobium sp.]|nr:nuclear transport factor 2 family protein [Novosphingobium sp.]MCP5401044.1 nuclear transport factor 2 family protein [Novosphingobium sp.]